MLATWTVVALSRPHNVVELLAALGLQLFCALLLWRLVDRAPSSIRFAVGTSMALGSVVLLQNGTGIDPGFWALLLLPVVFGALRSNRFEMAFAWGGAALALLLPIVLIGAPRFPVGTFRAAVTELVVAAVTGITVLRLVLALQSVDEQQRVLVEEARQTLATEDALRRIATLVASSPPTEVFFAAVAKEIGALTGGTLAGVVRFDSDATGEIVGSWTHDRRSMLGGTVDLLRDSAASRVYRSGVPAQVDRYDLDGIDPRYRFLELEASVSAPIHVGGRLWGAASAGFGADRQVPEGIVPRLTRFAELVAVAISNAQALQQLTAHATTDKLTGLANRHVFDERLGVELGRSLRHGQPLSLVLLDLDHFKDVNDTHGHLVGDAVLTEAARRIASVARVGDLVVRLGGEEFAWLMPETDEREALVAAERARQEVARRAFDGVGTRTISGGLCSTAHANGVAELFESADRALYQAKQRGRDRICAVSVELAEAGPLSRPPRGRRGGAPATPPVEPQPPSGPPPRSPSRG